MVKIIIVLLSRLLSDERLIQRLSESYPLRRAAQFLVYFYEKNKLPALEFKNLPELNGLKLADKLKKIVDELEKKKIKRE